MLPGKWTSWEITDEIGSGSYGTVYQIEKEDQIKAVKVIEIPQKEEYSLIMLEHGQNAGSYCQSIAQNFEAEIATLQLLGDCENIIHIDDYYVLKNEDGIGWTIYIFMDCYISFLEYSAMHQFEEKDIIKLAKEMTNALIACQEAGVIHRDIKPENILVDEENDRYLLCDFGLARQLSYKSKVLSVKGTYKYMAPEVYHGKEYSSNVDIYSLGLILYQYMNQRRGLFIPLDQNIVLYSDHVKSLERRMDNEKIPAPVDASPEFADIIKKMIAYDPVERYASADKLLKDLELLEQGKYHIKFPISHYRKQIAAGALFLAIITGYTCWLFSPVWKNQECGEATFASLNHAGTLTISGTGAITDDTPWYETREEVKKVVIKEGIDAIGDRDPNMSWNTFSECKNLKKVVLPNSMETLGNYAFADCQKLETINIPEKLSYLGIGCLSNSKWLEDHTDENGFVIENDLLFAYFGEAEEVVIPDGIKVIFSDTFLSEKLKKITLPVSLTTILDDAFTGTPKLATVEGGENVDFIGEDAFNGTKWYDNQPWPSFHGILLGCNVKAEIVTIPSDMHSLAPGSLYTNSYVREYTIGENIKEFPDDLFRYNNVVRRVTINSPIEVLPKRTFGGCELLEEIVFPKTLKKIYASAFTECAHLEKIRIPKEAELIDDINEEDEANPFKGKDAIQVERY